MLCADATAASRLAFDLGEQWFVGASRAGIYLFVGGQPGKINQETNFEWNILVALFGDSGKWTGLATYGMKIYLEKNHSSFKVVDYYKTKMAPVVNEPLAEVGKRLEFT